MSWERFSYICRKASAEIDDSESISDCLARVEREDGCDLYGMPIRNMSLSKKILDEIKTLEDKEKAMFALKTYSDLNLSEKFEEPMRFKRVVIYLAYVTFIFILVVGIYQVKVAPTFLSAFENFDIPIPRHLVWYQDYWGSFVYVVSILLVSSLLIGYYLRKIFVFGFRAENDLVIKYMVFRGIRESYMKVIDILNFPISQASDNAVDSGTGVINHLKEAKASNLSVVVEMQELLRIEMRNLLEKSELQMKCISVFVALVVVSAIFFFLVSAYSPIFVLGETI